MCCVHQVRRSTKGSCANCYYNGLIQWPIYNVIMIDMKQDVRTSFKTDNKNSKFNNGYVLIVRDLLNLLLQQNTGIQPQDIVIITPYLAQRVRHIRTLKEASKYNKSLENVIVSTVDKFQGQESNIVIFRITIIKLLFHKALSRDKPRGV